MASTSDFSGMVWVQADRWGGVENVSWEMVVHTVSTGGQIQTKEALVKMRPVIQVTAQVESGLAWMSYVVCA